MKDFFIFMWYKHLYFKWSGVYSFFISTFGALGLLSNDYGSNRISILSAIFEENEKRKDHWLSKCFKYKSEKIDKCLTTINAFAAMDMEADCEDFAMLSRLVYPEHRYKGRIVFIIHKKWSMRKFNHAVFVRDDVKKVYSSGVIREISLMDYLRHNFAADTYYLYESKKS